MTTYAYARVSTVEQNLDRQIDSFLEYGVAKKNIICDKCSGKDFERKNYEKLMKKLKKGDLLIIKSIDRLGRNYQAIIDEWKKIIYQKQANIFVLDMPILDTREKDNTLMSKFITDLVLQILSFVAENERQVIKTRQKEGIKAAMSRGVKFGRPKRIMNDKILKVMYLYRERQITLSEALTKSGLSRSNFYYHMNNILSSI